MIMFWNQKEVFVGNGMKGFCETREALAVNKIKYKYRVINSSGGSFFASRRATLGDFGVDMADSNMYYVYVHKQDYDNARAVLRRSY